MCEGLEANAKEGLRRVVRAGVDVKLRVGVEGLKLSKITLVLRDFDLQMVYLLFDRHLNWCLCLNQTCLFDK